MNSPSFTAEASLGRETRTYRVTGTVRQQQHEVEGQLSIGGACEPFRSCCLYWSDRQCCRDYFRCLAGLIRFE